jgi:deoxyribonuclease-4
MNAVEKEKREASVQRILRTARRTSEAGGYSITFHPAFYLKQDPVKVYSNVRKEFKKIEKVLIDEGLNVWVRPETTGKPTQFSSFDEAVKLSSEFEFMLPCIDFSHLHARSNGLFNTYDEFKSLMSKYEDTLGRKGLDNMHIHLSGIAYGPKGEKHHLVLKESDMNYKDLLKVLKEFKVKGCVISESPNIEKDALLMKREWEN